MIEIVDGVKPIQKNVMESYGSSQAKLNFIQENGSKLIYFYKKSLK